ncbi:hypothetical protein N7522_006747 [Penicillium canescens]|nr:hypothetical protein N7522_006747 [Penicillium canescens]
MALRSPLFSLLLILCVLLFNQPNGVSATASTTARPYSARMADSIISRGQAILENQTDSSSLLQVGIFQTAIMELIKSPSGRYMEQNWKIYVSASADSVVDVVDNATKDARLPLDRLSVGRGLLYLYVLDATTPSARLGFLIKSKPGP